MSNVQTKMPLIIQGGMGVAVSNWRLARAVSKAGQLGVVSGTFLETVLARRLQDGDTGGNMRRAISHFPLKDVAERILKRYFVDGGKATGESYSPVPMHGMRTSAELIDLTVLANFVEVYLAKENHDGLVGINYLTKIELPILPSLYGAMLAGVDYVLMGAGIPRAIPAILDKLSVHERVKLKLDVQGSNADDNFELTFDPARFSTGYTVALKRPNFIAIVSSFTLAQTLARKASGHVDGFVVEHHTAGGHNAPPRGGIVVDDNGEPLYGPKDEPSLEDFKKLNLPFWLAGSCGEPHKLREAIKAGAAGIQVGTAFAYCDESGIKADIKRKVIGKVLSGTIHVFTDPRASSSGYPFKVVKLEGSLSEQDVYENRPRICDLGYLRAAYKTPTGAVGFRCPAEPIDDYVKKGGDARDTEQRKCLCNALLATVDHPQVRGEDFERPLLTAGNELRHINIFLKEGATSYTANDVISTLLFAVEAVHR